MVIGFRILTNEKVEDFLCKILHQFKPAEFPDIVSDIFDMSYSLIEEGLISRKLRTTTKNLMQVLLFEIKKAKWNVRDILTTAFDLELEHIIRHSNKFEWAAHRFIGNPPEEEIYDINELILNTIRKDNKDALVLVKKADELYWISIIIKNTKRIGIYERPRYIVLAPNGRYFFIKDSKSFFLSEYLTLSLGYEKSKKIELCGKSLKTLFKVLLRRENADLTKRPIYERGEAVESESGIDFTQKNSFFEFHKKCMDNDEDLNIHQYTVSSVKCPWLGDNNPLLREMEFKSAITFSGNVPDIIKQLPVASIVRFPIPNYLRDYSVKGRNLVFLKPPAEQRVSKSLASM